MNVGDRVGKKVGPWLGGTIGFTDEGKSVGLSEGVGVGKVIVLRQDTTKFVGATSHILDPPFWPINTYEYLYGKEVTVAPKVCCSDCIAALVIPLPVSCIPTITVSPFGKSFMT